MPRLIRLFLFICFALIATFLPAQEVYNKATGLDAEIRMEATGEDEMYTIEAVCMNAGKVERILAYQMRLTREDNRGNRNSNSQGGEFSIKPEEEKVLSQGTINIPRGSVLMVELHLLEEGAVILSDTLTRIFPKKIKKKKQGENNGHGAVQPDPKLTDFGGLIVDQTRTRTGRDLYFIFYRQWFEREVPGDYIIRFEELPFRGRNTRIRIFLNDEMVLERILQPNNDFLENLGTGLVGYLTAKVQALDQVQLDIDNEIIGGDVEIY